MKRPLTKALFVLLALYHAVNCLRGEVLDPRALFSSSVLELQAGGRQLASIGTWHVEEGSHFLLADFGSRWLRDLGYLAGYRLGRVPDFLFLGARNPWQRVYLRSEIPFQYPSQIGELRAGHLPTTREWVRELEARGVTVVLLAVPSKLAIEREHLGRLPAGEIWRDGGNDEREASEEVYRALVDELPAQTPNLHAAYRAYRAAHPRQELYVPADTHWSSLGIALAAQATVESLRARGGDFGSPGLETAAERGAPDLNWDLLRPLQLPDWYVSRASEFAWREPLYTLSAGRSQKPGRVVVAGTCYSERLLDTGYSLSELLSRALARPRVQVTVTAGGAADSLRRFNQKGWLLEPGDILVWEFPLRGALRPGETLPRLPVLAEQR